MNLYNHSIRILLGTNGLVLAASAMLAPIYALFVEEVGGSLFDASITYAAFAGMGAIITFTSGKFADKAKESELIVVTGYLLISIGFFGYSFVDSVWTLAIAQAIVGAGQALYAPAFDALYSSNLDDGSYGSEWGAWETMSYIVSAICAILGGLIVSSYGFIPLFIIMGTLSIASALYIYFLPREVL